MKFQLTTLSRELEDHGLKHDDFRRVSAFCTIRLSSIRHQNGHLYRKKGKPFAFKPLTSTLVRERPVLSVLSVYQIIRLWARVQLLLAESRTQPRKKHHIRKLSRKIVKFVPLVPQTSEGFVFSLWAQAVAHFATGEYDCARRHFESFIALIRGGEELELAPWKSAPTLSRFCEYQLKKAGVAALETEPVQNPFSQNISSQTETVLVNGIAFDVSAADASNLKLLRFKMVKDGELSALISNSSKISSESIKELSRYPKLAPVVKYFKAMLAANISLGEKISKELYRESAPLLKTGLQIIRVQPLPDRKEPCRPSILDNPIPAKPIVYDIAYDLLQIPQLAKKSILGSWF